MEKTDHFGRKLPVLRSLVLHSRCPRCNEAAHIQCLYPIDSNGRVVSFHFCFGCGMAIKLTLDDYTIDPTDEIKRRIASVHPGFSGLMCLRLKDGVTEYYACHSYEAGGEQEIVSCFLTLLQGENVDRDGSYVAKWDEETRCVVKLNPLSHEGLN